MPKSNSRGIVEATRLGYNAEQSISYLVAEANVYNEWQEAAMWQHVCLIMRQRKNNRRWTKAEYDAWQMEREHERERQEIETLSPLMCELLDALSV